MAAAPTRIEMWSMCAHSNIWGSRISTRNWVVKCRHHRNMEPAIESHSCRQPRLRSAVAVVFQIRHPSLKSRESRWKPLYSRLARQVADSNSLTVARSSSDRLWIARISFSQLRITRGSSTGNKPSAMVAVVRRPLWCPRETVAITWKSQWYSLPSQRLWQIKDWLKSLWPQ